MTELYKIMKLVDKVNAESFTKCHNDRTKGHLLKPVGHHFKAQ